jgi:IS5 family transposase
MEDISDREFERFIAENTSAKWFCEFGLLEKMPDYTTICKFRNAVGTRRLGRLFNEVRCQMKAKGYCSEVFTFVDSTALIGKPRLREKRDKAITAGYEKLNNEVLSKVSADPQARIEAKSDKKFWYGFKKHIAADMQSGMITRTAVTPANLIDAAGVKHIVPKSGAVAGDKGFVGAIEVIRRAGLHSMIILPNNMKEKSPDEDRWFTKLRRPYERVFGKQSIRARYKGTIKNQGTEPRTLSPITSADCSRLLRREPRGQYILMTRNPEKSEQQRPFGALLFLPCLPLLCFWEHGS